MYDDEAAMKNFGLTEDQEKIIVDQEKTLHTIFTNLV
jgi:hypothetical protein